MPLKKNEPLYFQFLNEISSHKVETFKSLFYIRKINGQQKCTTNQKPLTKIVHLKK